MALIAVGAFLSMAPSCQPTAYHAPQRPSGLQELIATFGQPCNSQARAGVMTWPWGNVWEDGAAFRWGPVNHHVLLNDTYQVAGYAITGGVDQPFSQAVGNYACRVKRGGTQYSTHSWGIAFDMNSAANPMAAGNNNWDGRSSTGQDFGTRIPDVMLSEAIAHVWGINFSTPDPMHFQYVANY